MLRGESKYFPVRQSKKETSLNLNVMNWNTLSKFLSNLK